MNTFLFIMAVTPWSLLGIIAFRYLRRTPIYGKIWVVTERYMEAFDYKNEPGDASTLIFVKETEVDKDFLKGELNEQVDAGKSEQFIDDPRHYTPGG